MEILSVAHEDGVFRAVQELPHPAGGTYLNLWSFPSDTLEWRSAEYLIDPSQMDLLLDIVMYETVMPPENPVPLLYRADTIDEAREGHVSAILSHKQKIRPVARAWKNKVQKAQRLRDAGVAEFWVDALSDDALLPIRENAVIDLDVIVEKGLMVQANRAKIAKQRRVAPPISRAEQFRAMRLQKEKK